MRTEVFIEGYRADITADVQALFTYAVNDVADFSSRNTPYSKTINFPGTAYNNALFGHSFEFTGYNPYNATLANAGPNFNAALGANCIVLADGVQIFKGMLRLLAITINQGAVQYETAVFGELGGLVAAVGNKMLNELDFSSLDGNWNLTNITGSWSAYAFGPTGVGCFYPLIDYGQVSTNKRDYKYPALRPAYHVREYMDKIITSAGYTWDCAFFNTSFFKRLIIPHNEDQVYFLTDKLVDASGSTVNHIVRENIFGSTGLSDLFDADIPFPISTLNNFSSGVGNTQFTYTGANPANLYVSWNIRVSNLPAYGSLTFTVRKNGVAILGGFPATYPVTMATTGGSFLWTSTPINVAATVNNGDVITFHVHLTGTGNPLQPIDVRLDSSEMHLKATVVQAAPASFGAFLKVSNLIPKGIRQADFFMAIVKMFNLQIVEDPQVPKKLIIKTYPESFDNSAPVDWSAKVDRSKEMKLVPMSELNARYFSFQYDQDSDYYNTAYKGQTGKGYGDYEYDTAFTFVQDKKELKLPFAASPLVGNPIGSYAATDKYVVPIYTWDSTSGEKIMSSKIRILQAKRLTCGPWSILNTNGTILGSFTVYGYAGPVDDPITPQGADLGFGAPAEIFWRPTAAYKAPGLFNAFYSSQMAEITDKDSKLLSCYLRLTVVDILNLNFFRAVVIDGQMWRLNKIDEYDAIEEGVNKCEFLKVINLSY